jgi:predicted metal-dependent enzyme (double-stranded beta helix superfamily)
MAVGRYSLNEFISDMTSLVESQPDQAKLFEQGSNHLQRLIQNPEAIPEEYRLPTGEGPRGNHGSYLLHQAPSGLSVTAVVWGPGDFALPHDHGTWGMIGVLGSAMTETRYRRLDDRSQDDFAQLEQDRVAEVKPGEVTLLIPDVDEIHQMYNLTDRPTPEIHVYGLDLRGWDRRQYNVETGEIKHFSTTKWDNC